MNLIYPCCRPPKVIHFILMHLRLFYKIHLAIQRTVDHIIGSGATDFRQTRYDRALRSKTLLSDIPAVEPAGKDSPSKILVVDGVRPRCGHLRAPFPHAFFPLVRTRAHDCAWIALIAHRPVIAGAPAAGVILGKDPTSRIGVPKPRIRVRHHHDPLLRPGTHHIARSLLHRREKLTNRTCANRELASIRRRHPLRIPDMCRRRERP